jgi:serine kinase of HPr protein (carbohydrate metabolism regulator)
MSGLLQLTAVAIGGRAVLIDGAPGSGKSSLALALIDRGAKLVGDDGVALEARGGVLLARPAPATAGLIEVRNVGLVRLPHAEKAPACLVLQLDSQAPRFIDAPESRTIMGIALPMVRLWPDSPVLPLRAEMALQSYGLPLG